MLVDEITIKAKAGDGGDGVVRWRREKYKPLSGPAGGNGGKGGDVYVKAVRDLTLLRKYRNAKVQKAEDGEAGRKRSQYGEGGQDLYLEVPVGTKVTNLKTGRQVFLSEEDQVAKVLLGGTGGLGNEYFKSSTNRSPQQSTPGKPGEEAELKLELTLTVDVGIIGLPNAGKSSLLNSLTNAKSAVGDYPFTTLEPSLGDFYGYTIADIPGLIEGASTGKGLGQKFLRHISKTKMLLHVISLAEDDLKNQYCTIFNELSNFDKNLIDREEWIILNKKDLISNDKFEMEFKEIDKLKKRVFVVSTKTGEGVKNLADSLVEHLRKS